MKPTSGRRVNRTELAEILGVNLSTIDAKIRRGLPYVQKATGRGKGWIFDTAQVFEWERARAVESVIGESAAIGKEEADKRKAIAQAALAEYEVAERRRELISIDAAAAIVRREYSAVRARLLSMPAKLGPELVLTTDAHEARAVLEAELREVLGELSGGDLGTDTGDGETLRDEDEGGTGGEPPTAAEALDFGVGGPEPLPIARSDGRGRALADE